MEPISLILAALFAGATVAAKDTAGKAVKDAYEGLKTLIKRKFADRGKEADGMIVDNHKRKPDLKAVKAVLEEKLIEAGIDKDEEVLKAAQEVMKKRDPEGAKQGKYQITISGGVQGVVGDNLGTVSQTVTYNPK